MPAVLLVVVALVATGCGPGNTNHGSGRIEVVAATDVWGSVAKAVGGSQVHVASIIDSPNHDAHDYEPTPADTASIGKAQLTVANGGGYDTFFDKAVQAAGNERGTAIDAFAVSGRHGANANEHVFYDLPTVRKMAGVIATKLGRLDRKDASSFTHRAKAFQGKLDTLITKTRRIGSGKQLSAFTTESVADYLLEPAGITNATPQAFAEAVEKDADIPAGAIAAANRLIKQKKVSMLVDNVQESTDTAKQLSTNAEHHGLPVVKVTETLPAGTHDYTSWMRAIITQLQRAST